MRLLRTANIDMKLNFFGGANSLKMKSSGQNAKKPI